MTGRISIAFASAANVLQLIEDGKLTALAVAQPARRPDAALPTIDEADCPAFTPVCGSEILAPAGTPGAIVSMPSQAINNSLRSDDVARHMRLREWNHWEEVPEEFALRIKGDTARWDAVLEAAQLKDNRRNQRRAP